MKKLLALILILPSLAFGDGFFGPYISNALSYTWAQSQTFTGGLSTPSATITGGTINGTSIGQSTAAAGTFTSLASAGASLSASAPAGSLVQAPTTGHLLLNTATDNGTDTLQVNGSISGSYITTYKWAAFSLGIGQYADIIYMPAGSYGSVIAGTLKIQSAYSGAVSEGTFKLNAFGGGIAGTGVSIMSYGDYGTPSDFSIVDRGTSLGGGSRVISVYNTSGQAVTITASLVGEYGNAASYYATPTAVTGPPTGTTATYGDSASAATFSTVTSNGASFSASAPAGSLVQAPTTGHLLLNTTIDNGTDTLQVNGSLIASELKTTQTPTASSTASNYSVPIVLNGTTYYMRLSTTP